MASPKLLMTTTEAAEFLGVSKALLEQDRFLSRHGGHPPRFPFTRLGGNIVRYRLQDLQDLIQKNMQGV